MKRRMSRASNLGRIRQSANLTQAEAAEKLGYHQTSVSDWERGVCRPSDEAVSEMAALYGSSEALVRAALTMDRPERADAAQAEA